MTRSMEQPSTMKPTITNAFTLRNADAAGGATPPSNGRNRMRGQDAEQFNSTAGAGGRRRGSLGTLLSPMQADLRAAEFGFSLELSPIQAIDAAHALLKASPASAQFLVSVEQSAWRDGNTDASLALIAERLGIVPLEVFTDDQVSLSADALSALVAIAQPNRVLVVAVDGPIEEGDVRAIDRAITGSRSPLDAEVRAFAALEVLGDRSVVLHARTSVAAHRLVADNFRHYLAAILDKPAESFSAPDEHQIEALFSVSGAMTVRPIETSIDEGSIDIGVNTALERFTRPANASLIYDRVGNSWHME